MHPWTRYRAKKGWPQQGLADRLGLKSRGRIGDIERGAEQASAELAILMDRIDIDILAKTPIEPSLGGSQLD